MDRPSVVNSRVVTQFGFRKDTHVQG